MSANCEECVYYDYDEELAAYVCEADLDEDEMRLFIQGSFHGCPYFQYGAAHGTVPSTGPATITARPDGSEHDEP